MMGLKRRSYCGRKISRFLYRWLLFILFSSFNLNSVLAQNSADKWKLDSDLNNFPYAYKIGLEVEVTPRPLILMVNTVFNWDAIEKTRRESVGSFSFSYRDTDLTLDYLNSKDALEQLKAEDPDLAGELIEGLDLSDKDQFLSEDPAAPKTLLGLDGTPLGQQTVQGNGLLQSGLILPSGNNESTDSQPTALILGNENQRVTTGPGLILPNQEDVGLTDGNEQYDQPAAVQDWKLLNNRWNALPVETRIKLVRLPLMDARAKSKWLIGNMFTLGMAEGSKELFIIKDWPLRGKMDVIRDLSALEFRNYKPEEHANIVLGQLERLLRSAGQRPHHNEPLGLLTKDTSYHIHLSVSPDEREESLEPLLEAWNHLVTMKLLHAGIDPFIGSFFMQAHTNIKERGVVRLMDSHHIELRDHFTDPATEVSMFLRMISLSNKEALEMLYSEWMPLIDFKYIKMILINRPELAEQMITHPKAGINFEQGDIDQVILNYARTLHEYDAENSKGENVKKWIEMLSENAKEELFVSWYDAPIELVHVSQIRQLLEKDKNDERRTAYMRRLLVEANKMDVPSVIEIAIEVNDIELLKAALKRASMTPDFPDIFREIRQIRVAIEGSGDSGGIDWFHDLIFAEASSLPRFRLERLVDYALEYGVFDERLLQQVKQYTATGQGCREYIALCTYRFIYDPGNSDIKQKFKKAILRSDKYIENNGDIVKDLVHSGHHDLAYEIVMYQFQKFGQMNIGAMMALDVSRAEEWKHELEAAFISIYSWISRSIQQMEGSAPARGFIKEARRLMTWRNLPTPVWLSGTDPIEERVSPAVLEMIQAGVMDQASTLSLFEKLKIRQDLGYSTGELSLLLDLLNENVQSLDEIQIVGLIKMIYASDEPSKNLHKAKSLLSSYGYGKQARELHRNIHNEVTSLQAPSCALILTKF